VKKVNSISLHENTTLQSRMHRLKRAEQDLAERLARHEAALEVEGRWHKSDPLYQRLYFVLDAIRADLAGAETELRAGLIE
jgi:hypothetical protein